MEEQTGVGAWVLFGYLSFECLKWGNPHFSPRYSRAIPGT